MKTRKYYYETALRAMAETISHDVAISDETGNFSRKIKARKREREIAYGVLYGALLALNWGSTVRQSRDMEQGIIDTAEFTYNILMKEVNPLARGYETIYIPLQNVLKAWEAE